MTAPDQFDKTVVMLQSRSEAERYILMQAHPHLIDAALAVIARLTAERDALRPLVEAASDWSHQRRYGSAYDRELATNRLERQIHTLAAGAPVSGDGEPS